MTHGSLFTGIGGFDLAAKRAGFTNLWQVEKDEYCLKLLEKNFPHVKKYKEIKTVNGKEIESVDVISGGFPCQPFSFAGKRRGKNDDRSLWHEMFRVIKENRPPFVICENVPGLISMELDKVLFDLEGENYKTETFVLPALSVGAPHIRNRVWIIAYSNSSPTKSKIQARRKKLGICNNKDSSYSFSERLESSMQYIYGQTKEVNQRTWTNDWVEVATELCGMDDGLPARMDGLKLTKAQYRGERLKALGNSIVPQIAYLFFEAIKSIRSE